MSLKLNPIGANQNEIEFQVKSGEGYTIVKVLFSYKTAVACQYIDGATYRTATKWSRTTSKHINNWLAGRAATEKPQPFFDNLIK